MVVLFAPVIKKAHDQYEGGLGKNRKKRMN